MLSFKELRWISNLYLIKRMSILMSLLFKNQEWLIINHQLLIQTYLIIVMGSVQLNHQLTGIYLMYETISHVKSEKTCEPESKFIEIKNPKKANIAIRCFYKHQIMNLNEFNKFYVNNFLDKLSEENETVFLPGKLTINLLNYHQRISVNNSLIPCLLVYF